VEAEKFFTAEICYALWDFGFLASTRRNVRAVAADRRRLKSSAYELLKLLAKRTSAGNTKSGLLSRLAGTWGTAP